jgi:dTDP-4-amino-4,6-dideoxygalactose transaminase
LQINHIESRRFFHPLHNQPAFSQYSKKNLTFPVAEQLYKSGLCLPSSTSLTHDEVKLISHKIVEYFETNPKTLSH